MITCTLKSAQPDLILPLANFSSRMFPAVQQSSITVFIPSGVNFADEIALRIGGYIELDFNGVVFAYTNQIDSIQVFEGTRSTSIQISASGNFPIVPLPIIDLKGVSFKAINVNGDVRLRAKFDPTIVPGATVNYDNEAHIVDQITVTQRVGNYTMEIFANA